MNIKELREKSEMTQAELARKLNIGQSTLSQYETGARGIDSDTAKQLATIFEVSLDDIYGYTPVHKKAPPANANDAKIARIMELLKQQPLETQLKVVDMLEAVLPKE